MVLLPPTFTPAQKSLPSPFPLQEAKEGEGAGGGQGSPSVLRLHRVFRLNQENFYYQKRKKRKKNPSGHLSSLPHWDSQDWICGAPGRVAQGWNTLRQEWWSSLAGPPPGPLWASPLSPLLSPFKRPTRGGLPCPQALGLTGLYSEAQWGTAQPWRGWAVGPWLPPHHILCPSPELGTSFHELLWGYGSPPQKSVPSSGGLTPVLVEGREMGHGLSAPRGQLGNRDTASPFWESLSESTAPHHPPTASPSLALIWAPFSSHSLAFSSWHCRPSSQETVQGLHGCLAEGWIGRQGQESLVLHRVGQSNSCLLTSEASV